MVRGKQKLFTTKQSEGIVPSNIELHAAQLTVFSHRGREANLFPMMLLV